MIAVVFQAAPPIVTSAVLLAVKPPPLIVTLVPLGPLVGLRLKAFGVTVTKAKAVDAPKEQTMADVPAGAFVGMVATSVKAPVPSVSTEKSPMAVVRPPP